MIIDNIKNICVLLFVGLVCLLIGLSYGYMWGTENINDRMIVSVANDNWKAGQIFGSSRTTYLVFEKFIKEHPYRLHQECWGDKWEDVPEHERKMYK